MFSPVFGFFTVVIFCHIVYRMIIVLSDRDNDYIRDILGKIPLFCRSEIRVVFDLIIAGFNTFIMRCGKPAGII